MRLIYIALAWVTGLLLAANSVSPMPVAWLVLVAASVVVVALLWTAPHSARNAAISLLALTLGGLRFSLAPHSSAIAAYNNTGGLTIEGMVADAPDVRDTGVLLRVAAETLTRAGTTTPTDGLVLVRAPRTTHAVYGDRIRATGLLISPAEFDTFSYGDYLARSGVYSIMSRASVEIVAHDSGNPIQVALFSLRQHASDAINTALPEPAAGLLNGILLGDERGIAQELRDAFSITGAAHLLAISGFNMVVLAGVVQRLLRRAGRGWAAGVAITAIVVYTALVGASPGVLRAAVMSSLLVLGGAMRRSTFVPTSLAFAALVLSLVNPTILWDIGFQLSFFATLGLSMFATPFHQRLDRLIQRALPVSVAALLTRTVTETVAVSLAAMVTTLPLTTLYFGQVSLVSLVVNLLVVPVQPALLLIGGLAVIAATVWPPLAQALFWLDLTLLSWTGAVVRWFARVPNAQIEFGVDPRLVFLFFATLIGWGMAQASQPDWLIRFAHLLRTRTVQAATLLAGVCTLMLVTAVAASRPDGMLHVWLLDVGGYNAILAQTPGGAHVLVDGGSFPSRLLTALGDRLPFNDREIEVIAITQPDEANFSALSGVLHRYNAGVVLTNGQPNLGTAWQELQDAMGSTERVTARTGYVMDTSDGVRLEVLSPHNPPELDDPLNDGALVLRLSYASVSFLLTSDLSTSAQRALVESGQVPASTVLQLPQGGTALEPAFLDAAQPQAVVMQNNSASRHLSEDVVALLDKTLLGEIPLFRTDGGGTLHLWTNGQRLWAVYEPG